MTSGPGAYVFIWPESPGQISCGRSFHSVRTGRQTKARHIQRRLVALTHSFVALPHVCIRVFLLNHINRRRLSLAAAAGELCKDQIASQWLASAPLVQRVIVGVSFCGDTVVVLFVCQSLIFTGQKL